MSPKYILLALVSVVATAGLLYLLFGHTPLVPLQPIEPAPRPPVVADSASKPQLLMGLHDPFRTEGIEDLVNAKRRARNDLAERHAAALAEWKKGERPLREVEAIEEMLVVAMERTGEIDMQTVHERLAELFEREVKRLEMLRKTGHAGESQLQRARLYLARELYLAGQAATDPRAAGYPEARIAYLEQFRKEQDTLVESGLAKRGYADLEYQDLLDDFPEPPVPAPDTPA